MPVSYSLEPLADLVEEEFGEKDPVLVQKFKAAINGYCEQLKKRNEINDCNPPLPDELL